MLLVASYPPSQYSWNSAWTFSPGRNGSGRRVSNNPFGTIDYEFVDFLSEYATSPSCKESGVCGYDLAVIQLVEVGEKSQVHGMQQQESPTFSPPSG
jgi:hypothetical protein